MESLVEHTTEHDKAAMWLLIFTGMRPAELFGLRVEDVDLVRSVVHIRRTWSAVPGSDGGSWEYVEGPVKTASAFVAVPGTPAAPQPTGAKAPALRSLIIGDDLLEAAVATMGPYACRCRDGIAVVPAALLGP